MSQKIDMNCSDCGKQFQCDPRYANKPKCYDCLQIDFANKHSKEEVANAIKDASDYTGNFEFKLDTQSQKLTAVMAQGEVFAQTAGPDLMLTEFIENAFDAIKKQKVLLALDLVINQIDVNTKIYNQKQLAIDRHTLPKKEFDGKHPNLSNDEKSFLDQLWKKILENLKSQSKKATVITIEIDSKQEEVRIIDCGTGIEHPIHICEEPFVSLKTGEDYTTGKFGRGSQVFRAFCELMEFYSVRSHPSNREHQNIKDNNLDVRNTNTNSIKLVFPWDYAGGNYTFNPIDEYKKLSGNTKNGTVVILSKWKEDYFSQLVKHPKKLETRLQHHFGFALDDIFNISLKIRRDSKEHTIEKMDFDELSKPENLTKIDAKFELPNMPLKDKNGNSCGEIEFHLHKTHRSYSHAYKEPFLIVNGRPMGDTAITDIPEMSAYSDIWKSSTITGYVICDSIEVNQMRTGLGPSPTKQSFVNSMTAASIELKKLNTAWKNELSSAQDREITNEVIQTVSSFLSKKGIKFNFKNPLQKGSQKDPNNKSGEETTEDRVSNEARGPNQGLIDSKDGEEVNVGYRKTTVEPGDKTWDPNTIIVPHGSKKKDGNTVIAVKVKKSLVSKGGRKVRKSYSGPDLDFNPDEDSDNELSYFEADPPCVWIQSEHTAWKKLVKKARDQTNAEKFEKEKKEYLMERYLWEIMDHESTFTGDDMTDKERKDLFWTYYHDLLDTK